MAGSNNDVLTSRPNAFNPLTLADVAAICAVCNTELELWWMLEPYVVAHLWDVDDILVIWYDVKASIAQQESQRLQETQMAEEQKAQPKRKLCTVWAKGCRAFREVLKYKRWL